MKKTLIMIAIAITILWSYSAAVTAAEHGKQPKGKKHSGSMTLDNEDGIPKAKGQHKCNHDGDEKCRKCKEHKKRKNHKDYWNDKVPLFVKWVILKKYDTDNDGELNESERAQWKADSESYKEAAKARREAHRAEFLTKWDTNNDGELSQAEKDEARRQIEAERQARREKAILKKFDKNGDGVLSDAEQKQYEQAVEKRKKRLKKRFDFDKDGKLEGNEKWALEHRQRIRRWIKRLYDADMDGKLSEAERAQIKADLDEFRHEMLKKHGKEGFENMEDSDYWNNFQKWQEKRHEKRKKNHPKGGMKHKKGGGE